MTQPDQPDRRASDEPVPLDVALGADLLVRNPMDRFIDGIELIAAFFVGLVAADTFVSVLLRYFFSVSIPDSYDFGRLLLGILIFWGIAATSYRGTHITVDLLYANVGPKLQRAMDVFATLVLLFCVTVQTYTLFDKVVATYNDNVLTFDLRLPTWPFFLHGLARRRCGRAADRGADLPADLLSRAARAAGTRSSRWNEAAIMSTDAIAVIGFVALFVLMLLRVPVGMAMGLVGVTGFGYIVGAGPALKMLGQTSMRTVTDFNFAVVPMFLLMGSFATTSGMSRELFRAGNAFLGHLRGGLGIATIAACGGFAAICGSSVATAATFSRVAYPEMLRFKYPQSFATGVIAAGGTLGIMIPPSTVFAVYGLITEQDVGKLFIAGILPGMLAVAMYMITITIIGYARPGFLPAGPRASWSERLRRDEGHLGDAAAVRVRDRRHLWRDVHRHRSRRLRRCRRFHHRRGAREAVARRHPPLAARSDPHHRGGVHRPDRRDPVRLFPDRHADAAEGDDVPDRTRRRRATACSC